MIGLRAALVIALAFGASCSPTPLSADGLVAAPDFHWKEQLFCTIERASKPTDVGYSFTLTGLKGSEPSATFQSGNGSPLKAVFEDDRIITLQQVAWATGSVDTIIVDKNHGIFARSATGMLGSGYADGSFGVCR